jgi:hypothetical protein
MRRNLTWALVGAIGLIAAIAVADALRGSELEARPVASGTTTREQEPTLADTLREELVIGQVLYSDADCVVHSLEFPEMFDQTLEGSRCELRSTDGWILAEDERLSPNWRFIARCSHGEIVIREADTGTIRRRIDGCAPAWRPQIGNRLTWARGEAVYERGRPLLNRRDLHAIARHHPNVAQVGIPFRVRVTDLAWLDIDHLILSLQVRGRYVPRDSITVLLEGKTVLGEATSFQGPTGDWFASSAGSFAAAENGTILTAGGETSPRPDQLTRGRAVAFSPDERWLAFVTEQSIYLLGTPRNAEPGRIIRIPVAARDLAWERVTTTLTFPRPSQ